ncbi:MAG: hypothetical protein AB4426_06530 [Xenococcaceae cyanobacterium]
MINSRSVKTTALIAVGLLAGVPIIWSMPCVASETPITPTGTAASLEGVQPRSLSGRVWEVLGTDGNSGSDSAYSEAVYEIHSDNNGLLNRVPSKKLNQEWENSHSGDRRRTAPRVPIVNF